MKSKESLGGVRIATTSCLLVQEAIAAVFCEKMSWDKALFEIALFQEYEHGLSAYLQKRRILRKILLKTTVRNVTMAKIRKSYTGGLPHGFFKFN